MKTGKVIFVAVAALLLLSVFAAVRPVLATDVVPDYYDYNITCADLGYDFGLKYDANPTGDLDHDFTDDPPWDTTGPGDSYHSVSIFNVETNGDGEGWTFDWASTLGIDAVIVKSQGAYVYVYDPESYGDSGLFAPFDKGISHIDFCYDYEVDVDKTAETSYTRDYDWSIDKIGSTSTLLLSAGQTVYVDYTVTVDVAGWTDSDWAVSGDITIANNTPFAATIESVEDELSVDGTVAVDCGVSFPYSLAAWDSMVCTYSLDLGAATDQLNTAAVKTSGIVGGGEASADVVFGDPTDEVDACITVSDDQYGDLFGGAPVCADGALHTATYTMAVGPYFVCQDYEFVNIASYDSGEGETGSAGWTVVVTVVGCQDAGCSLTPGYWKTHSSYGPAPYDDTWAIVGEDTPFFLSGQSYYEVLWTNPSGGNAYYILAHAYIAAGLNFLNGSDPIDAQAAYDAATVLFNTYTPLQIANAKGKSGKELRDQFIALAGTLDAYNNGLIGPGHCSE